MKPPRPESQQAARDRLAASARRNRALRGTAAEKPLDWQPCDFAKGESFRAKVGSGTLTIYKHSRGGINYVSSFGPNSEKSFSGFLPGLTMTEAKNLVHQAASRHW